MNSFDKFKMKNNQLDMFEEEFSIGNVSEDMDMKCWSVEWLEKWGVEMEEVIYDLIKKADKL